MTKRPNSNSGRRFDALWQTKPPSIVCLSKKLIYWLFSVLVTLNTPCWVLLLSAARIFLSVCRSSFSFSYFGRNDWQCEDHVWCKLEWSIRGEKHLILILSTCYHSDSQSRYDSHQCWVKWEGTNEIKILLLTETGPSIKPLKSHNYNLSYWWVFAVS